MAYRRALSIINAPTNLGLSSLYPGHVPGTDKAPSALRDLGLHHNLRPRRDVSVSPPPRSNKYDPGGIRHVHEIASYTVELADVIAEDMAADRFVLLLGGDCSILLAAALAGVKTGVSGLLYIDGHTDFHLPEQSTTGGAAGMDLALACGWGPDALTDIYGKKPYFDPLRTAALANRDLDPSPPSELPPIEAALGCYLPLAKLRTLGMTEAMNHGLATASPNGERYWIHLDVDALDSVVMPAVDSPQPDGLSVDELEQALRLALAGNAAGLQMTIYDPDLDQDGSAGRLLVDLLTRLLAA